ncbi:MAG: hypothetical protein NUV77_16675 [Thermoguttaceae bacterium]|nr:hypothetical protein [Thermoguttaceae bacterium]
MDQRIDGFRQRWVNDYASRVVLLAALGIGLAGASPAARAQTEPAVQGDPNKATSSRAARDNAIESIPFDRLSAEGKQKVQWVLQNTSVFRRLPIRVVQCDADLYLFLVEHPDVVVNIWEVLGVSHLTMRQTGPDTYQVTDDIGTTGSMQFLYRSRDTHVLYVDGTYTGSMFGHRVRGRGLMVLKSGYVRDVQGRCFVTSRLDAFMNVEPGGAEFLTKTFQPVVGKIADTNFLQTVGFLACLSRTAEVNLPGMQRLAARLAKVSPQTREQLAQLAQQAAQRAAGVPANGPEDTLPDPDAPRVAERPDAVR